MQCKSHRFLKSLEKSAVPLQQKRFMANYSYKQQYGVVVICEDEKEQQKVYEMLRVQGLTLKVVTV